ncbi:MAG: ATP-binding protein [Desulfurellales bacterium]|nr:MAG: ATP-binding protein [Desulfurellales bacterium]
MAQQLIIVRGLPGSGKTTLARVLARTLAAEHCEADSYFARGGSYKFDPRKLDAAHADCLARAKIAIDDGRSVVVANTFTRRWEMQPYLDLAADRGIKVIELVAVGKWQNTHNVPSEAIERMRARWED